MSDQNWPEGATVRGWYAGGSAANPWSTACVWLAVPNPTDPTDDPHLTVRPAHLAPPGLVLRETFGGTRTDDELPDWRRCPCWVYGAPPRERENDDD
jgi:hypothetical protein